MGALVPESRACLCPRSLAWAIGMLVCCLLAQGRLAPVASTLVLHSGGALSARSSGGLERLPVAAQGPVSAVLGRDDRWFSIRDLRGVNAPQGLELRFGDGNVVIGSGSARVSLGLASVGRPRDAVALSHTASPLVYGNRVQLLARSRARVVRQWSARVGAGLRRDTPAARSGRHTARHRRRRHRGRHAGRPTRGVVEAAGRARTALFRSVGNRRGRPTSRYLITCPARATVNPGRRPRGALSDPCRPAHPTGREARWHRRVRRRLARIHRRRLERREHGSDRCAVRWDIRRGVGLHAFRINMEPAGHEAHRRLHQQLRRAKRHRRVLQRQVRPVLWRCPATAIRR